MVRRGERSAASWEAEAKVAFIAAVKRVSSEDAMALIGKLADEIERAQVAGALTTGSSRRRALVGWSSLQAIADRGKLSRILPDAEQWPCFHVDPPVRGQAREHVLDAGEGAQRECRRAMRASPGAHHQVSITR